MTDHIGLAGDPPREQTAPASVTVGDGGGGKGQGGQDANDGTLRAAGAGAGAREAIVTQLRNVTQSAQAWRDQRRATATPEEAAAPQIRRRNLWHDGPAPAAEVVDHTRSGAWLLGEQNVWFERVGKAYGYAVALPVTLLCGLVAWLIQRPLKRLLPVLVVGTALWMSWPADDTDTTPPAAAPVLTAAVLPWGGAS